MYIIVIYTYCYILLYILYLLANVFERFTPKAQIHTHMHKSSDIACWSNRCPQQILPLANISLLFAKISSVFPAQAKYLLFSLVNSITLLILWGDFNPQIDGWIYRQKERRTYEAERERDLGIKRKRRKGWEWEVISKKTDLKLTAKSLFTRAICGWD